MSSQDLLSRVQELRRAGLTAPQMARELGLTKAQLQPLLRRVAGSQRTPAPDRPLPEPAARELVGCWIVRAGAPAWA